MARFNTRKKIIATTVLFLIFIWGLLLHGAAILSDIQYNHEISDMMPTDAYIMDIKTLKTRSSLGIYKKMIKLRYKANGVIYEREVIMIVDRLFQLEKGVSYSVGDKITIYYELGNPKKIVYPNSAQREMLFYECTVLFPVATLFIIDLILDRRSESTRLKRKKKEQDA